MPADPELNQAYGESESLDYVEEEAGQRATARRWLAQIEAQAVRNKSMPLGNETGMTEEERARLGAWTAAQ